jgi:hypothetical protein
VKGTADKGGAEGGAVAVTLSQEVEETQGSCSASELSIEETGQVPSYTSVYLSVKLESVFYSSATNLFQMLIYGLRTLVDFLMVKKTGKGSVLRELTV